MELSDFPVKTILLLSVVLWFVKSKRGQDIMESLHAFAGGE